MKFAISPVTVIFKFAFSIKNFAQSVKRHYFLLGSDCIPDPTMPARYMLENIMAFVIMFSSGTYPYGTYFMCAVGIAKKSIQGACYSSEAVAR